MFSTIREKVKNFFIKRVFYEGARRTQNRDFYEANAPFENTASTGREIMRARARWLHENNGIISGIDNSIINNVVGNGLKLQVKTDDNNLNNRIEDLWNTWCERDNCDITKRQHFGDIQRLLLGQRMMDGEILIVKHYNKNLKNPFSLQLIEADRLTSSLSANFTNYELNNFVDGLTLDNNGAVTGYSLEQPNFKYQNIKAQNAILYYKMDNRATQYRGISEYKQAIIDLRNLAGYQSSLLKTARVRANIGYIVETDEMQGRIGSLKTEDNDPLYDINGVMVEYLNPGEKIKTLDPAIVGLDYSQFVTSAVRTIAVARKISYELAFRDYSKVNFSSARASIIQDHKRFSSEQWHLVTYVLRPVFWEWLTANVYAGNIKGLNANKFENNISAFKPLWIPPRREWVDPLKDMKAIQMELNLGLTTLKKVAGSRGDDIEDLIKQRSEEIKMLKSAGIMTDQTTGAK